MRNLIALFILAILSACTSTSQPVATGNCRMETETESEVCIIMETGEVVRLTDMVGYEDNPTLSPDGTMVAFERSETVQGYQIERPHIIKAFGSLEYSVPTGELSCNNDLISFVPVVCTISDLSWMDNDKIVFSLVGVDANGSQLRIYVYLYSLTTGMFERIHTYHSSDDDYHSYYFPSHSELAMQHPVWVVDPSQSFLLVDGTYVGFSVSYQLMQQNQLGTVSEFHPELVFDWVSVR